MKTISFKNVFIKDYSLLIGKEEKQAIKKYDFILNDYYDGEKSFEQTEIKMQRTVIEHLINKNRLSDRDIGTLISADLSSQITSSSYAAKDFNIPFLGVYAACASFTESLLLAGLLIKTNDAQKIITSVSSHALASERQFRFPIEYGHSRPSTATVTATGAIATLVTNEKTNIEIKRATIGKVIDMGIKDVNHMGAVMVPSCANTLYHHLNNTNQKISDFDLILTGDLGKIGVTLLKEYYQATYHEKLNNLEDGGSILYSNMKDKYSGGSGPCCLPLVLLGKIIPQHKYHHILIIGTGALHSTLVVNQKLSIPSVSHAIEMEIHNDLF